MIVHFIHSKHWTVKVWTLIDNHLYVCAYRPWRRRHQDPPSHKGVRQTTDNTHGFPILNMNASESNFLWISQIWGKNQQIELNAWSIFFWSNACCSGFIMFMLLYSGISFTWEHVWEEDLSSRPLHWRQCLSLLLGLWLQLQLRLCYHLSDLPPILWEVVEEPQEEPHRRLTASHLLSVAGIMEIARIAPWSGALACNDDTTPSTSSSSPTPALESCWWSRASPAIDNDSGILCSSNSCNSLPWYDILPALYSNSLSMIFHVELRDGKKKVKNKNKKKKKKKKCSSYTMLFKLSLHKTHVCDLLLGLDREQKDW